MPHATDNLNRVIAVGAVLLALSMQVEQAGVFCYLGACGATSSGPAVAATVAVDADGCCDHHACPADHDRPMPGDEPASAPSDVPCPCPESCWCRQVPLPLEMPKLFEAPEELAFQSALAAGAGISLSAVLDRDRAAPWRVSFDANGRASVDFCARFCRFLI